MDHGVAAEYNNPSILLGLTPDNDNHNYTIFKDMCLKSGDYENICANLLTANC